MQIPSIFPQPFREVWGHIWQTIYQLVTQYPKHPPVWCLLVHPQRTPSQGFRGRVTMQIPSIFLKPLREVWGAHLANYLSTSYPIPKTPSCLVPIGLWGDLRVAYPVISICDEIYKWKSHLFFPQPHFLLGDFYQLV